MNARSGALVEPRRDRRRGPGEPRPAGLRDWKRAAATFLKVPDRMANSRWLRAMCLTSGLDLTFNSLNSLADWRLCEF